MHAESEARLKVAVVGAGVVGLQTAWQLRKRGHRVVLVDPEPGRGASWAAAGMLAPASEVQFGQERLYPLMLAARAEYPQVIADMEKAADRPHGWRDNGTLLVAGDRADLARIADHARVQTEHGMTARKITAEDLRHREPGLNPRLAGGYEVPDDHQVDPRLLMSALTDALTAVQLPENDFPSAGPPAEWRRTRAERIDAATPDGPYRLTCDDGATETYDRILLAPGLGYGKLAGLTEDLPLDLRPVYGDILRLRLRPGQLAPGEKHLVNATIRASVLGRSVYLVPRADGGLVVGASVREDDLPGVNVGCVQEILEDAVTVAPGIREAELVETIAGARPGTPDDIPYLGRLPHAPGVVVSTGYSRHGILLSPLGARLAADLLTGADPTPDDAARLEAMDPTRFRPTDRIPAAHTPTHHLQKETTA